MEAINTKQLAVVKGQVTKAEKIAAGLVIKNDSDYEMAGEKFIEIKNLQKAFDKEYDEWMSPINELRNKVFEVSRPMKARFEAAKKKLGDAMDVWEKKVEAERQAASADLEAKAESGDMSLAEATDQAGKLKSVEHVSTSKGKIGKQIRHELSVADASKLPRKFLVPDMAAIKEHYQSTGRLPAGVILQKKEIRTMRSA